MTKVVEGSNIEVKDFETILVRVRRKMRERWHSPSNKSNILNQTQMSEAMENYLDYVYHNNTIPSLRANGRTKVCETCQVEKILIRFEICDLSDENKPTKGLVRYTQENTVNECLACSNEII